MKIPGRTVERLSKYRRLLLKYQHFRQAHIFSHDMARAFNLTPAQVRRDFMLIGIKGNHRKGYEVQKLIGKIGEAIDNNTTQHIALVGIGNLGKAVTTYLSVLDSKLKIVAAFDIDNQKIGKVLAGVSCYGIDELSVVAKEKQISIAVLTVPPDFAQDVANLLVSSGIKGILNFTSVHIVVPSNVYLKDYDIITSLEEIAYYTKSL